MGLRFLGFIIVSLIILPFVALDAEARSISLHGIGVYVSDTCERLIKNDFRTNCPTYADLLQLDSSDTTISGKFTTENGWTYRERPPLQNSWRMYDFDARDNHRIFVDPTQGMGDLLKNITIESNIDRYRLSKDKDVTDYTIKQYQWRYVSPDCKSAVISADRWMELLPDTINYMRNNCSPDHTKFKDQFEFKLELVEHDITTSYKYKLENWQKKILDECTKVYGGCKEMRQP